MTGVYRNPDGTYTYQPTNDFEDRRRRQLDDQYAGRPPFGPRPVDPRPPVTWAPPVWHPQVVTSPASTQPPANDFTQLLIQLAADAERRQNDEFFDSLVSSLPNRLGESRWFDQVFDDPNTEVMDIAEVIARFNAEVD